jgi:cathepsin D
MGMAFESISQFNASSVFETLVREDQTTSGVFAFKLASSGSELSIGGLNDALYSDTPTYTPLTEKAHWQIEFSALKVDKTTLVESSPAIVDSVRLEHIAIMHTK